MSNRITDSELAIVEAALLAEPALTAVRVSSEKDRYGTWVWDDVVAIEVGPLGAADAVEVDELLINRFATDHAEADGRECVIAVTDEVRTAVMLRRRLRRAPSAAASVA